jgi:hypothetical protein
MKLLPASVVVGVMCVALWVSCPDCIDRTRVNKACEWTGDTVFPIDPREPAHWRHLVADAQLAEELAIRHADAEFSRRFGVEHHGGLIDNGRFRRECLSRLFGAIEANHGVTPDQIRVARGQRNGSFDVAVGLLFVPFYVFGAHIICLWLARRFSSDGRSVRRVAMGLASIVVSLLGLQAFRLWGAVWEVVRVGNGHMTGMRLAPPNRWPHQYVGADFLAGVVLFWLVAAYYLSITSDEHSSEFSKADGILLR